MGNEVPRTFTPIVENDAEIELTIALTNALSQVPPEQVGVYSLALAWIETGGGQSCVQHNPGNLLARGFVVDKSGKPIEKSYWSGDYWRPPWFYDHSADAAMYAGRVPSAFRAYPDRRSGWTAFVGEVVRRRQLLEAMMTDDAKQVVQALVATKYSPDYRESAVKTFESFVRAFRSRGRFAPFRGVALAGAPVAAGSKSSSSGLAVAIGFASVAGIGLLFLRKRGRRG